AAREAPLELEVALEAPLGVDGDHLTRAEPPTPDPTASVERDRAGLGGADDEAVRAGSRPKRPQPVPVERGADDDAVGEDEPGRAVPRLDEAGVVAVEVADLRLELVVALPRCGNEHRERMPDVAAAADEQF